jgi:hypothetical protein
VTTTSNATSLPVWDIEDLARKVIYDDLLRLEQPPVERLEAVNDLVIWLLHVPDRLDDPTLAHVCERILRSRKPESLRQTTVENIRSGMAQLAEETRATLIVANEPRAPRQDRITAITRIRQVALACISAIQHEKHAAASR